LPINGWTGMTIFLAASAAEDAGGWGQNTALYWKQSANWGLTFLTPSQSHVFFRFGTTQVNNQPIYTRPANIAGDYSVTTAIHSGSTDSLYVNGVLALRQAGKRIGVSGATSMETIGTGFGSNFFRGSIGEILVYDRALTDTERQIVERYLMRKFGIQ
jgi:hypothetical protein